MKYYNVNKIPESLNIYIHRNGYGKFYKLLIKLKKNYEKEIKHLMFINNYKNEDYPTRYYIDKEILDLIDYLLKELEK